MIDVEKEMKEMEEWGLVEFDKNADGIEGWRLTEKGRKEAEMMVKDD